MRLIVFGEMAEWSIAAVLKTVDPQGSGGSNPSLSAKLVYGQTSEPLAGVGSRFEPMKSRV